MFIKTSLTEEEKRAISQNLGHENVGTTFNSYGYGKIDEDRQIEVVKNIKFGNKPVEVKYQFTDRELGELAEILKVKEAEQ